jgi:hypothetical protein
MKDTLLLAGVPLVRTKRNQVGCESSGRLISPGDKRLQAGSLYQFTKNLMQIKHQE